MQPLGKIINKQGISFHCYSYDKCTMDMSIYLLRNSDKTGQFLLGPQAARRRFSDYTVTLVGLSVTSCAVIEALFLLMPVSYLKHM